MYKIFVQKNKKQNAFLSSIFKPSNFLKRISPPCPWAQDTKCHRNVASLQNADSPIAVDMIANSYNSPVSQSLQLTLSEDPVSSGVFTESEPDNNLTDFSNFSDTDFGSESDIPSGFYPDRNTHPAY